MSASVELRAILRDEITAGLKGIKDELHRTGAAGKEAGAGISGGMSTALPTIRGVTDSLGQQVAQLRAQRDAMKTSEYKAYAEQQRELRREIEAMTAPQAKQTSGIQAATLAFKGFIALQAVGYVKDFAVAVYDATAEMDSLRRGMNAVMHSSGAAAKEMEALREVAKLPGLGYSEAVRMSISLQSAGMSAKMAREAMMSFGNALAIVGKGKADLEGVGLALSQIMSKGKVSAEEINQIAERVPQIRIAMKDAFGTADTEAIQKMGLTSKEFIAGVTAELGKLEKATGGVRNSSENLSDAWFQLKANLGDTSGLGSAASFLQDTFAGALNFVSNALSNVAKQKRNAEINGLMMAIAFGKEQLATRKDLNAQQRAEIEATLNQYRASLAKYADVEKKSQDKRTDGQKMFDEAMFQSQKESREKDLEGLRRTVALRTKEAEGEKTRLVRLAEWEKEQIAAINKKWDAKEKKPGGGGSTRKNADSEAKKALDAKVRDYYAALDQQQKIEKDAADFEETMRDLDLKEERDALKEQERDVEDHNRKLMDMNRWLEDGRREMREKEQEEFEKSLREELSAYNANLGAMIRGKASFSETVNSIEDAMKDRAVQRGLERLEEWIAQQITMMAFSDAAKTEQAATSAALGASEAASYAPAAVLASTASFGTAAVAGGAALAAVLSSFAFADRGSSTLRGGRRMIVGENRPEEFVKTVPGQIHNTTNNSYGNMTFVIQGGGDSRAIAREVKRALSQQADGRLGGSH